MKISEKTVELNFCAQVSAALSGSKVVWFGLTQKQEAKMGFDTCTKLGGKLLIFQFKVSNQHIASGERRFRAGHKQLIDLRKQCKRPRSVFYVFPMLGETLELAKNPDLLTNSWLLDVSALPCPMSPPTKKDGALRKSGIHYVDISTSGVATIHSEPQRAKVIRVRTFVEQGVLDTDGIADQFEESFPRFWKFRGAFSRGAFGMIVFPSEL